MSISEFSENVYYEKMNRYFSKYLKIDIDIDIDIEILFFVEYSQTCNISAVGLLFQQTRVKQHAKNITACNKNTIRTMNKLRKKKKKKKKKKKTTTEYWVHVHVYHSMQILYIKIYFFLNN